MTFLILFLSIMPCSDKYPGFTSANTELNQMANDHDHHSDVDLCSPFCTCQCCQANIEYPEVLHITMPEETILVHADFIETENDHYYFRIYIPPKA